jgi:hypothetical protein
MRRFSRSGIGTTAGFGLGAFSKDELDSIHYSTLQILQDTGIKVMNEEALRGRCLYRANRRLWYCKNPLLSC